jgi:hypothetical protein
MKSVIDTNSDEVESVVKEFYDTELSTHHSTIIGVIDTGSRYRLHVVYSVYTDGLPEAAHVGHMGFVSISVHEHTDTADVIYETVK